jgi:(R)-2-hydroxyacyl-CoA dehydratese activating ATPase
LKSAGIDMGSTSTKVVILGDDNEILSYSISKTKIDAQALTRSLLNDALVKARLKRDELAYIVGTGYGRHNVSFDGDNRTEIMCHAVGIHHLFPTVKTILDVGGQDSKAIRIDQNGRVKEFIMSDKCAAGTGRFLEVMAGVLQIPLEKWGEMVSKGQNMTKISNTCTVFAETEIISNLAQKTPTPEIITGLCDSLMSRVLQIVYRLSSKIEPDICFTGGVAQNGGAVQVLSNRLGGNLLIPKMPQITGALGAAILAKRLAVGFRGK